MNILLINPINKKTHGEILRFPIGLAYIFDILRKNGHRVEIMDLAPINWDTEYLENKIPSYKHIDAVGLTGLVTEYLNIKQISRLFKKYFPKTPVVLGGALATSLPDKLMDGTDVDIIVTNEGELTAAELFEKLEKKEDISAVRGIYFRDNGKIIFTGKRDYLGDLDILGYPSRDNFNVEAYFCNSPLVMFGNKRTLNMITSRGCPYECAYCDKSLWGSAFRARSPENVVSEIEYLIGRFNIDSIIFHDDTFNISKHRLIKLCDLLTSKKIKINWLANCRASLMSLDIAKRMRKAGCRIIAYGVESGNQDILNSMKKNIKIEDFSKAIQITWKARIAPFAYLMIGWFNETKAQVFDTINFCIANKIKGDFSFFTPLPNTSVFKQVISHKKYTLDDEMNLSNWSRWHENPMINVSSMEDAELIGLKKYAEKKIFWSHILSNIILYIKVLGVINFIKEIARRVIYAGPKAFKIRLERV